MRILVAVRPYQGHLQPILPLLTALRDAGHVVVVATAEELAPEIEWRDFGWVDAGVHPAAALLNDPDDDPSYGLKALCDKALAIVDAAPDLRPDLLLTDATDLAGALAAELFGLPSVAFSVCRYLPLKLWRQTAGRSWRTARAELGLPPDRAMASLLRRPYLDLVPPSLQSVEVAEVGIRQLLQWLPADRSAAVTAIDLPTADVVVSFGTVFNDRPLLWRTTLGAFSRTDLTVVATGVPEQIATTGGWPSNVTVCGYVPHAALLARARLLVCHGGFNTMMGAITAGVPMICLPIAGDQHYNAWQVERLGLGARMRPSQVTQAQLLATAVELIDNSSYSVNVRAVRDEIATMPTLSSAVAWLSSIGVRRDDAKPARDN